MNSKIGVRSIDTQNQTELNLGHLYSRTSIWLYEYNQKKALTILPGLFHFYVE